MSRVGRRANTRSRKSVQERRNKVVQARSKFTRAKAEKLIAQSTSESELRSGRIAGHPNIHVQKKAAKRLRTLGITEGVPAA